MAEAFAVAAGGFGAASLAIQLIEKFGQLTSFLRALEDAPQKVSDIANQMDSLNSTLIWLEQIAPGQGNSASLDLRAEQAFERAYRPLQTIFQSNMAKAATLIQKYQGLESRSRFTWSALKTVFGEKELEELMQRMERAVTFLMPVVLALITSVSLRYVLRV